MPTFAIAEPTVRVRKRVAQPGAMRAGQARRVYWTRERVLDGLRRFRRDFGATPTATEKYDALAKGIGVGARRVGRYPSFNTVLRHFPSFWDAWAAVGVDLDNRERPWSDLEEWYLREAAGFVSRVEMARDLRRTPEAVHRRLYDLGLHSYRQHGWTLNRLEREGGIRATLLLPYVDRGILPVRRGTKCHYVDPADLAAVPEVDWGRVSPDLERAARRSLIGRLAGLLDARTTGAPIPRPVPPPVARPIYRRPRRTQLRWSPHPGPLPAGIVRAEIGRAA